MIVFIRAYNYYMCRALNIDYEICYRDNIRKTCSGICDRISVDRLEPVEGVFIIEHELNVPRF